MRVGSFTFQPRPLIVFCYLLVASLMITLALWQLRRADEKIYLHEAAEQSRLAPPVALQGITDIDAAAAAYKRVTINGCYVQNRQLLWDNRSRDGRPGFEVITPLRLENGTLALVNRGWLPMGRSRQDLPDTAIAGGESTCVTLDGTLTQPSKGFMSGAALPPTGRWPRILQYFDYAALAQALGAPTLAGVVQLQETANPSRRPEALLANWQPAASGPERHYGYAFQWFAMATALTVLFVVLNTRRAESSANDTSRSTQDHR